MCVRQANMALFKKCTKKVNTPDGLKMCGVEFEATDGRWKLCEPHRDEERAKREQKKSSKNADVALVPVADEAPTPRTSLGDVELYVLVCDSLDRLDGVLSDGVLRPDDEVGELGRAFGDLRLVEGDLRLVELELLRRRPSLAARGRA